MTTYGSVCSGIEAASVALEPLGMRADWLSEIEPFPSAVLAHHWPHVPNLGDMTQLPSAIRAGMIKAPDVLVGGTPCQAFSVAGLRKGLDDDRGQLTLTYVDILNAIDEQRPTGDEAVCVWENVPGVLSSKDNAFGCFLASLVGEDMALESTGKRWPNAGAVFGPQRTAAWRILDAQYFGLAQRRKRVFVVASARTGFDPCAVLFESEGVRRDTPPSRESGEEVAGTLASRASAGGFPGTDEACSGAVQPVDVVGTLDTQCGYQQQAFQSVTAGHIVGTMTARGLNALGSRDVEEGMVGVTGTRARKLTPVECERLQGFPDNHTQIPWRNKLPADCPDGPRYKACGNSKAVPVVRWIGQRLLKELRK